MGVRVAIAVAPLCACAAVLGIDDGHPRAGGGDDGGAQDGAMPLVDGGPADSGLGQVTLPDGAPLPPLCDPDATLDASSGIFIATSGVDSTACTEAAPCKTIQHGINLAQNATTSSPVYVQGGTYGEQLTLAAGVDVVGGWSGSWAHDCSLPTTVQAPSGEPTTVIASFNGTATLSTMTIESKDQDSVSPGETIVGIQVTGASTTLNLRYVEVTIASGGDGLSGNAGDAGPAATGACSAPGDGGSSDSIGGKGMGADAGWFTADGFGGMTGGAGGPGGSGVNGTAGPAGTCEHCYGTCTGTLVCSSTDGGVECGDAGAPGCGGPGGFGGLGGGSGGSSIALFVSEATVSLTSCALKALNGGNGGAGGPGGGGGQGSNGAQGAPSAAGCNTTCASISSACSGSNYLSGQGGAPGGVGGMGAPGGTGGDGAGGDSYVIVQIGGAVHQVGMQVLDPGLRGLSADGGNGAPGTAGIQVQF